MEKLPKARNKMDVPKTEEKELTDEQIINALKVVKKETLAYAYDKEKRRFEYVTGKEILDLIHRLQAENEQLECDSYRTSWKGKFFEAKKQLEEYERKLADGELVSKDWHDEQVGHAEEEIERLTEENEIIKGNPPIIAGRSLGKTIREKLLAFDQMKEKNAELQKQVDELKKDLRRSVELLKEGGELAKMNEQIITQVYEQAVKDTAKECYEIFKFYRKNYYDIPMDLVAREIKEKTGVEVE